MRYGKVLTLDFLQRKSSSSVPFTYSGMARKSLCTKQLCTNGAMTDVRLSAKALNASSIATEDADVVQHGGFFHKLTVGMQFGMVVHDGKCLVCHFTAVHHENVLQRVFFGIVFVDDGLIVHGIMSVGVMSVGVRSVWVNF